MRVSIKAIATVLYCIAGFINIVAELILFLFKTIVFVLLLPYDRINSLGVYDFPGQKIPIGNWIVKRWKMWMDENEMWNIIREFFGI